MQVRMLEFLSLLVIAVGLSGTLLALEMRNAVQGPLPLLLTVGSDSSCAYDTLQQALNVAQSAGPENDIIRIATNHNDTSINAEIVAHSVTIEGGYAHCADSSASGWTELDGTGGSVDSVLYIHGGAIDDQHMVLLRDLVVTGGENDGAGGGLDIRGGMNVRLEGTLVENNASAYGGGIAIQGSAGASLVIAAESRVLTNDASQDGGGVYCEGAFVGLYNSAIAFNEANNGGGLAARDGCLFHHQSGGTLLGVFLNDALSQGGGIDARSGSTVELTGGLEAPAAVVSNDALGSGGGIWVSGATVQAKNASIFSNTGDFGGGVGVGIGGHLTMERLPGADCHTSDRCSTLSGNVARRGAALYVNSQTGLAEVRQTYIEGNLATEEGSGAYVTVGARLVLEGVVVADNQGGESVIKLRGGTEGLLAFVTMTDNDASDAAIVAQDSTFGDADSLEIYSSILWEPSIANLLSFNTTPVEVDCLVVNSNLSLPPGDYISVVPPIFVDAVGGDYHLQLTSPAVDYCDSAAYGPTHRDVDHQVRGWDHPDVSDNFLVSWFDIGADEFNESNLIFSDGFESGDTAEWSSVAF